MASGELISVGLRYEMGMELASDAPEELLGYISKSGQVG